VSVLVGVGSVKGSPGVTTLGLGLASVWAGDAALFVEADPSGGDVAVWYRTGDERGLVSLAAATRRISPSLQLEILDHTHDLGDGLYVLPGPVGAGQAHAAVGLLAQHADVVRSPLTAGDVDVVVVDLGRLDSASGHPLLAVLDAVLLVARGTVTDLAHLAARGPALTNTETGPRRIGMVLTGDCRYRIEDVQEAIGLPVLAALPRDEAAAATLAGAPAGPRFGLRGKRFGSRPLMVALRELADDLAQFAARRRPRAAIAAPAWATSSPTRTTAQAVKGQGENEDSTRGPRRDAAPGQDMTPATPTRATPARRPGSPQAAGWTRPTQPVVGPTTRGRQR
jgi:hypothetical protein